MVYAVSRLTIIFRGFLADVCLVGVQLLFRSKERNIHGHKQAHSQTHTHTHTHTHRSWQKRGHDTCCCHSLSQLSPERAQTKFTWKWHQMLWGCSICVCVPVHNHRRCMSARSCLCAHLDARACMFSYPPENTYTRVSIHLCVCVRVCVCVCVCVCVFLAEALTEMDEAETALRGSRVLLRQWPLTSARPAAADMLSHCALVNGQLLTPCKTHTHTHTNTDRWVSHPQDETLCVHVRVCQSRWVMGWREGWIDNDLTNLKNPEGLFAQFLTWITSRVADRKRTNQFTSTLLSDTPHSSTCGGFQHQDVIRKLIVISWCWTRRLAAC